MALYKFRIIIIIKISESAVDDVSTMTGQYHWRKNLQERRSLRSVYGGRSDASS